MNIISEMLCIITFFIDKNGFNKNGLSFEKNVYLYLVCT